MLLNKIFYIKIFSLIILFLLSSCGDKNEPGNENQTKSDFNDSEYVLKVAKETIGENVKFAYTGSFNEDSLVEVSAGTEIVSSDNWGIKFYLLKIQDGKLLNEYETDLLDGSFNECLVKKIKFPSFNYELVYYNSLYYYLGSGGGEVFSYIVDFNSRQTYYAHLFAEPGQSISLYLSGNIQNPDVKNFFISNFKRDYPSVKIVSEDVDLKY